MDSTGSKTSIFGGFMAELKEQGMAVLETGTEVLGGKLVDAIRGEDDSLPPTPVPKVTATEYQQAPVQEGTANQRAQFMGMPVNPTLLMVSLGLLGAALVLRGR